VGVEQARRTVEGAGLSPRERDVLAHIAEGLTNEAIAKRTFLSVKSIEAVVRSLFLKLGLVATVHDNRRVLATRMYLNSIPVANSWPAWATAFVGRAQEVQTIGALLDTHRLVTVVGIGGIGKTRTVAQVVQSRKCDAVTAHFVDLASAPRGGARRSVLDAFDIQYTTDADARRQLDRVLRARPRLIVIDNAETHLDDVRHLVCDLLCADNTRVVVTSREPVGVAGERLFRIPPLSRDDSTRLLRDRIADVTPLLETVGSLDEILDHVNGVPLAAELLAARFAELQFDQVISRLPHLPALLERQGKDRHRSLRSVLDSSYELLDHDAQDLFQFASVLVGGFTRGLLHDVFGSAFETPERLDDALDRLLRTSLFSFGHERLRMLEPVRQYAAERLDVASERPSADTLLIAWCDRLAHDAFHEYPGHPRIWRSRLLPESATIEVAIRAALRIGNAAVALRACGRFSFYWMAERPGAGLALTLDVLAHATAQRARSTGRGAAWLMAASAKWFTRWMMHAQVWRARSGLLSDWVSAWGLPPRGIGWPC
jgi:predicted ATPase/DNA-binding CsgD family transcriptional regulator